MDPLAWIVYFEVEVSMDTERSARKCPRCGLETLTDYVDEDSDVRHGARCMECGFRGFYVNGELRELVYA
jgi:DNA-directed RNA polymerase subunit RPC12/RpoP